MTSDQYDQSGQDLYQRGEYEQALAMFREGLARFPKDPDLQLGCSMSHIQLGDYIQAGEILEGLRRRSGKWPDVLQGLTEIYLCLGKKTKALECVQEAVSGQNDPEFLHALAMILYRHHQFKEAAACYEKAADTDPGYAPAHLGYGVCCHRLGNTQAAVEALRCAISADPGYWEAYSYLGNLLYDLKKKAEAKAFLGKIPVDRLWDPAAIKRLTLLYNKKEDKDKLRAVQHRQREVERILQTSREQGLLDELSQRLDRDLFKRQPRNSGNFWSGKGAGPKVGLEMDEILQRMFDAPCAFEDGRRPRLVRFDKALCEKYLACLTLFLNQERRSLGDRRGCARSVEKRNPERSDAASLLFYGAEIIREMRLRFKKPIIDKGIIARLQRALRCFEPKTSRSPRARSAWLQAAEALK